MTENSNIDPRVLERAATMILEMLPEQVRDLAIEIADLQYHIPRWHVVAGAVLRLAEEGRVADFSKEVWWDDETLAPEVTTCKQCGELFDPERIGQVFCSNECGTNYNMGVEGKKDYVEHTTDTVPDFGSASPDSIPDDTETDEGELAKILRDSAEQSLAEITT